MEALVAQGMHCSMAERRADDASRDVMAFLKCEFLQEHVGSEFDGVIAAVTGFGMFVELKDLYIEGLVHISALPQDYYQFDQAHQRLIGERTRRVFQLGDTVRVQVMGVDLDQRKIDLALPSGEPAKRQKPSVREALAKGLVPPANAKSGRGKATTGKSSGSKRRSAKPKTAAAKTPAPKQAASTKAKKTGAGKSATAKKSGVSSKRRSR